MGKKRIIPLVFLGALFLLGASAYPGTRVYRFKSVRASRHYPRTYTRTVVRRRSIVSVRSLRAMPSPGITRYTRIYPAPVTYYYRPVPAYAFPYPRETMYAVREEFVEERAGEIRYPDRGYEGASELREEIRELRSSVKTLSDTMDRLIRSYRNSRTQEEGRADPEKLEKLKEELRELRALLRELGKTRR